MKKQINSSVFISIAPGIWQYYTFILQHRCSFTNKKNRLTITVSFNLMGLITKSTIQGWGAECLKKTCPQLLGYKPAGQKCPNAPGPNRMAVGKA
ncbi:hypothetical protein [Desulfocicer niacini]